MKRFKEELVKSIRYIIPIIAMLICIILLKNYSEISSFIVDNYHILMGLLTPFFIGFIIAYIFNQPMKLLEKKKRYLYMRIIMSLIMLCIIMEQMLT